MGLFGALRIGEGGPGLANGFDREIWPAPKVRDGG